MSSALGGNGAPKVFGYNMKSFAKSDDPIDAASFGVPKTWRRRPKKMRTVLHRRTGAGSPAEDDGLAATRQLRCAAACAPFHPGQPGTRGQLSPQAHLGKHLVSGDVDVHTTIVNRRDVSLETRAVIQFLRQGLLEALLEEGFEFPLAVSA